MVRHDMVITHMGDRTVTGDNTGVVVRMVTWTRLDTDQVSKN